MKVKSFVAFLEHDDPATPMNMPAQNYRFLRIAAMPPFLMMLAAGSALAQQTYPTSSLPVCVAAGDLNGDGLCDAITADWYGLAMSVFKGTGNGLLVPYQSLQAFGQTPSCIKLADLNADGNLDIALATWDGTITLYKNDGTASFTTFPMLNPGSSVNEIQVADMNLDGLPDIVSAHNFINKIAVFMATGGGNFGSAIFNGATPAVVTLAVGEMNHDGLPDLVVGGFNGNSLTVLLGDGAGGFPGGTTFYTNNIAPHVVEIDDMNLDGVSDVLLTSGNSYEAQIWKGNGGGNLAYLNQVLTNNYPGRAAAADLNRDGIPDIAMTSGSPGMLYKFYGTGNANFAAPVTINLPGNSPSDCRLADLGHNGVLDCVLIDPYQDLLIVQLDNSITPAGTAYYGTGTPGCKGWVGINANQIPYVGNANFAFSFSNVPRNTLGLGLAGNVIDFGGTDYFGVGILIHFDAINSTDVQMFDIYTDNGGAGFAPVPIPNNNALLGATYYACGIFLEDTAWGGACSTSYLNLDSSRGLKLFIQ